MLCSLEVLPTLSSPHRVPSKPLKREHAYYMEGGHTEENIHEHGLTRELANSAERIVPLHGKAPAEEHV